MAGAPAHGPARVLARAQVLARLPGVMPRMMRAHCEVAALHADRLGLPQHVRDVFPSIYERWDGKGGPARLRGTAVPRAVRIAHVARDLDAQITVHGPDEAAAVMQARAARAFDPDIVDAALELGPPVAAGATWDAMLAAEPNRCSS